MKGIYVLKNDLLPKRKMYMYTRKKKIKKLKVKQNKTKWKALRRQTKNLWDKSYQSITPEDIESFITGSRLAKAAVVNPFHVSGHQPPST